MLDLFLGPDDAAVALLLALGVPALILAPWVFVRTLMDWLRVADTTARVGGAAYAAAARVTSRAINNTWRTFLCLALLVTSWALTWRAVDEFAYERLLEHDLTWAQRLHYLLVGTPDGYTAPTAAYIAIGTAGTWLLFLLVRSSLGFAIAEGLAWCLGWISAAVGFVAGVLGIFGLLLGVVGTMGPNPGSPEVLSFLIGSGQLLLICGAGIAAYATVHLVSWRFRDFHGGKHLA